MEEWKLKVKNVIAKLKTIKNIEIIVGVVIICIVALIYSSITVGAEKGNEITEPRDTSGMSITEELEYKLQDILSEVSGAGKVRVMITFDGSGETVTAHTSDGKGSSESKKELLPEIKGVLIVAEGAGDMKVRINLLNAAKTLLNVNSGIIQILVMK